MLAGLPESDLPDFSDTCSEYAVTIPLRILALRDQNPMLWSRVNGLMDHVQEMKEEELNMWNVSRDLWKESSSIFEVIGLFA